MRLFIVFFVIIVFFFPTAHTVFATGQTLKIMTFNTGGTPPEGLNTARCPSQAHVDDSVQKVRAIANYIKSKGIEIALLQEMAWRCKDKNPNYEETEGLAQELDAIGYHMDYAAVPYDFQGGYFRVSTFSRYPIDHPHVVFTNIPLADGAARGIAMTPIITDFGTIPVYNFHTRNPEACNNLQFVMKKITTDNKPLAIVGGDFNIDVNINLRNFNNCLDTVDGIYLPDIISKFTYNLNSGIDYISFLKTAPFSFVSTQKEAGVLRSDHDPVVSIISTTLPLIGTGTSPTIVPSPTPVSQTTITPPIPSESPSVPTASPTNQPNSCSLFRYGDADCNDIINLHDYQCWRAEYSFNTRPGSCINSNFDHSAKIDVLDFAIWAMNTH